MPTSRTRVKTAAWPQAVAVLVGVLFAVMGVVGFAATGLDGFPRHDGAVNLFGLAVNPAHNLLHLAIGAAGIVMSARLARARIYGWVLVVGLGALFGYGVLVSRLTHLDVLNLNWPDNWLHLAFAVVGLAVALGPARSRPIRTEPAGLAPLAGADEDRGTGDAEPEARAGEESSAASTSAGGESGSGASATR